MAVKYYKVISYNPLGNTRTDYIATSLTDELCEYAHHWCTANAIENAPLHFDTAEEKFIYYEGCDCYIEEIDYHTYREESGDRCQLPKVIRH